METEKIQATMKRTDAYIIIPARLSSRRIPEKPLQPVNNLPLIACVYSYACKIQGLNKPIVATDSERISKVISEMGGKAILTPEFPSGSDRVAYTAELLGLNDDDIIINLQGDMLFYEPQDIIKLVEELEVNPSVYVATLGIPCSYEGAKNPNRVKIVLDNNMNALYFSRSVIPYVRDGDNSQISYIRHIGIYAFRKHFLVKFTKLQKSYLEEIEKLEQLRILENGYKIKVITASKDPIDVDSHEDLEHLRNVLKEREL